MKYFPDTAAFKRSFSVPRVVAEDHLKLATATQLRVLLYLCNSLTEDPSDGQIAAALGLDDGDVADALGYWKMAGILVAKTVSVPAEKPKKQVVTPENNMPTKSDIIALAAADNQIKYLLDESELKFGKTLSQNEMSTIVWLYSDCGFDISVILMLLEFAKQENKLNAQYIEKTATCWIKEGIDTIEAVDEFIKLAAMQKTAWGIVRAAFGIEARKATSKELQNSYLWVNEWGFSREILVAAYEKCVDTTSSFSMNYIAKILKSWHEKGYKTLADIENDDKQHSAKAAAKNNMATYDIGEIERLLRQQQQED